MRNTRTTIFFLLFLIATFLALAVRCFYLQYFRAEHYLSTCLNQQQRRQYENPWRGVILDRCGRVLAASNKIQTIFAEPRIIEEPQITSTELAEIVNIPAHEICQLITESKNPGYVKIKTNASVSETISAAKIYGVGVQSDWQRRYPTGHLAGHVVGFSSRDNRGLSGIELACDKELMGSSGKNIFLSDSARRPLRLKQQKSVLTDGSGIILTIDATIQQFVRAVLLEQYKKYQAESAVAIVAVPKTGEILAMVSLPDFEPENFNLADLDSLRNRAITDQFEPGSILKPIVIAVALDAGAVKKDEKIFCEYGNYHGKGFGRIGEYGNHKFGKLSIKDILVHSSNIGMAKIGQKLGKDKLYTGLKLFGFGRKTEIDLPGEVPGLLWPVNQWTGYSVTRIPFGQEITVTAMQIVRAFCILTNGGHLVKPYVVKAKVDNDGKITMLKRQPASVGFIIRPEVAKWIVEDALVAAVNEGTGTKAKLEKWQVFGKTGTANIAKKGQRGYSDSSYIASFISGAPAKDPAIVVLVSIRKPNKGLGKGYTGGTVAAPVAAEIIEKTLTYLENHSY